MAFQHFATIQRFAALACCAGITLAARPTAAQGIETTVAGTVALGRSANALRVNDFMATWLNPANLAVIPSTDLGVELRLPLLDACFDRARNPAVEYRTATTDPTLPAESFDKVCNKGGVMPTGNVGWAQAFPSGWGYGVGFFTPTAVPGLKYGQDTIVTQAPADGEMRPLTTTGLESPNRFLLLQRAQLGGFLQAGAGVQLAKEIRVGLALGLGFATIHNVNVGSVQGGTFQDQELLTDVHASDWAIPRAMLSVVAEPIAGLDVLGAFTYQSDVDAGGYVDFTSNGIQGAQRTDCRSTDPGPGPHCRSDKASLKVPFTRFVATLGVRYASRRTERKRALDPMKDERWDVEINGSWSETSHVDQYVLQLYDQAPGSAGSSRVAFSSALDSAALSLPAKIVLPYHWRDTFSLRVGGDYNLIASKLAVRAGLSYESNATPTEYMNIDAFAVSRYGLHVGATYALGRLKLSIAYAHIFYQSVDVAVGQGRVNEVVAANPERAQAVNEGSYSAALNVISVQANGSF